eukprot:7438989-Ditylum_brightwellii.AAC.2
MAILGISILSNTQQLIQIGLAIQLPTGIYGCLAPRSGITSKKGIDIGAGVIDTDYRGEIQILIINNGNLLFEITTGIKLA